MSCALYLFISFVANLYWKHRIWGHLMIIKWPLFYTITWNDLYKMHNKVLFRLFCGNVIEKPRIYMVSFVIQHFQCDWWTLIISKDFSYDFSKSFESTYDEPKKISQDSIEPFNIYVELHFLYAKGSFNTKISCSTK